MGLRRKRVANEPDDSIVRPRAGVLFLVATPIGNLADLSPRAHDTLRDADLLLAEDTRHTSQLLNACGIARQPGSIESLHEHNERARVSRVIERLLAGGAGRARERRGHATRERPGCGARAGRGRGGCRGRDRARALCRDRRAMPVRPADRALQLRGLPAGKVLRSRQVAAGTRVRAAHPRVLRGAAPVAGVVDRSRAGVRRATGAPRSRAKSPRDSKARTAALSASLAQRAAEDPDMSRGEIVLVVHGAEPRSRRTTSRWTACCARCWRNCPFRRPQRSRRGFRAARERTSTTARSRSARRRG